MCAAASFSIISTVPVNFIDIAPILTTISALTESGPVVSSTAAALDARHDALEVGDRGEALVDRPRRRERVVELYCHGVLLESGRESMDRLPRVSIPPGTYRLGPDDGTLSVRTERTGAAAKAGHNLADRRHRVGGDARRRRRARASSSTADATSLRVREGTGGMQALDDDDKANIEQTIDDEVLKRQDITLPLDARRAPATAACSGRGRADAARQDAPARVRPRRRRRHAQRVAVVKQTDWGMKPYSGLFGALKVVDEVLHASQSL